MMGNLQMRSVVGKVAVAALCVVWSAGLLAQARPPQTPPASGAQKPATPAGAQAKPPAAPSLGVPLPPSYVIGIDDVVIVDYWKERDYSLVEGYRVRPDGKLSLPQLGEVQAAGLTVEDFRLSVQKAAAKLFNEEPSVTVQIKEINSRKVYITGQVNKVGVYPIMSTMTLSQLIAMAGGLTEFAEEKRIILRRYEQGKQVTIPINYKDIREGKKGSIDIELRPGDTISVNGG